jgi:hypothetical protein
MTGNDDDDDGNGNGKRNTNTNTANTERPSPIERPSPTAHRPSLASPTPIAINNNDDAALLPRHHQPMRHGTTATHSP